MSYKDIYFKRVNRYGNDYQSRIQGERERNFDLYLLKTLYRVDFIWDDIPISASFEKYKQDETKTLHYLLTKIDVNIPNGTILEIPNSDGILEPWMVYYLEDIQASGYNRYIMLRMTHFLTWIGRDGEQHESWAYMYGQENNMLKDELKSRSRNRTLYTENLKLSFFIMPKNEFIKKDVYMIVGEKPFQEYYVVTGYDLQSTDGIQYVSVDPVYEYDLTPPPEQTKEDSDFDFYWLNGGVN